MSPEELYAAESATYERSRPRCRKHAQRATHLHRGVPMHWMLDWPLPFPLVVAHAKGATLTDIDGHVLADFCLGDTAAMFGHSAEPVARAIAAQAARGLTTMLPSEDACEVGELLAARFGLPHWQVATTASDANRFALRVARAVTGRPKILVFNGCYHGAVDETFVRLREGRPIHRPGLLGQFADLTQHTRVIEFNDVAALDAALSDRDVACVITEPVLTNSCMVLPQPGFHAALRTLTRAAGTLLLMDETHTISTAPGGYTRAHGLEPDLFVLGKPVAGGVPAAVWGFTDAVATGLERVRAATPPGHSGMGTTLSGNALALAAIRATLTEVTTDAAYARMERLAQGLSEGLDGVIARRRLPWHVVRIGARVEFICARGPLRNGAEAEAAHAPVIERTVHLALLNRGALIAPFHNMILVCPSTTSDQVDHLVAAFDDVVSLLS